MRQGLGESAGWSEHSSPDQSDSDLACGGGLNTGKMASACRLHGRAPHLENEECPSSPHPEVTHLSLSPRLQRPQSRRPSTEAQGECLRGPFLRMTGFPTAFCLTLTVGIPSVFHSQMCVCVWGPPPSPVLWSGEPGVGGWGPLFLCGEPAWLR